MPRSMMSLLSARILTRTDSGWSRRCAEVIEGVEDGEPHSIIVIIKSLDQRLNRNSTSGRGVAKYLSSTMTNGFVIATQRLGQHRCEFFGPSWCDAQDGMDRSNSNELVVRQEPLKMWQYLSGFRP